MDSILSKINLPADLKDLSKDELTQLASELRQFIIESVSVNPSHLGASLGVVELTIALHKVYDAPFDKIIWDVGHQAYGHKILTGRRDSFHTNRKYKGLSGFPKISESVYDAFGVGHASTSISAALGMALGGKSNGDKDPYIVAVLGDGALTGGMAFEGLNNAGIQNSRLLVVLNDNHMAIDPNVGALKNYLPEMTAALSSLKNRREAVFHLLDRLKENNETDRLIAQKLEDILLPVLLKQSNFFEAMQFKYFGPVNGHSLSELMHSIETIKDIPGPKLLHVLTTKGKGFWQAEQNQTQWHHSPGVFDKLTGELTNTKSPELIPPKYQEVFGHTILELARIDDRILGITPAMPSGSSLNIMMDEMPERVFDVGIAEQHAVTFSAGLALSGKIPFCNIYSTFMQRAYDQLIHDVALQNIPVIFCLDRAGLVGADGATHHGSFDLAFCRIIPNLIVASPFDEIELRNLMFTAYKFRESPFIIRYPRGRGSIVNWRAPFETIAVGTGRMIKPGKGIAILSIGPIGQTALVVSDALEEQGLMLAVYDMRFLKPLDESLLHSVFANFDGIITLEDGVKNGGLGSSILEFASDNSYCIPIKRLGIPDYFVEQGSPAELRAECGFDAAGIQKTIIEFFQSLASNT